MTTIENSLSIQEGSSEDNQNVRQRLLKSAIKLFGEKGYAATSVNEIVTAAGVTKPNLYYYFTSKEGIYTTILTEVLSEFDEILNRSFASEGTARERIQKLSVDLYQQFVRNIDAARMIYSVYFGPPQSAPYFDFDAYRLRHFHLVGELIGIGIAKREFQAGDPHIMTMAVVGLCHTAMELELCHSGPTLGQEGLLQVLDLLFEGCAINQTAFTEE